MAVLRRDVGTDVGEKQLGDLRRLPHRSTVTGTLHDVEVAGRECAVQQLDAAPEVFR